MVTTFCMIGKKQSSMCETSSVSFGLLIKDNSRSFTLHPETGHADLSSRGRRHSGFGFEITSVWRNSLTLVISTISCSSVVSKFLCKIKCEPHFDWELITKHTSLSDHRYHRPTASYSLHEGLHDPRHVSHPP